MSTPDVAGAAEGGAGARVCAVCGAGLEPGAAFCGTCGTRVPAAGAPGGGAPGGVAAGDVAPGGVAAGDVAPGRGAQPDGSAGRVDPSVPTRPGESVRTDPLAPGSGTGPGSARGAGAPAAPGWSLGADVDDAVAPVWRRLVALVVDQALAVLVGSAGLLAVLPALRSDGSVGALLVPGLLLLLLAAGQWFAEAFGGRTVGGALLGTRTVSARTGRAPGLWAVLVRSVVQALGVLLGGVGVYVVAGSGAWDEGPEQRGWHDKAAGTLVLRARAPRREDPVPAATPTTAAPAPAPRPSGPTSGPPRSTATPSSAEVAAPAVTAPRITPTSGPPAPVAPTSGPPALVAPTSGPPASVAPTSGPAGPVVPTADAASVEPDLPTRSPDAPADREASDTPREPAPAPAAAAPVVPTPVPEVHVRPEPAPAVREDLAAPVTPAPVGPATSAAASDGPAPLAAASTPALPDPETAVPAPGVALDLPPTPVADGGARPPRHAAPTPAAPAPSVAAPPTPAPATDATSALPAVPTPADDIPLGLPDTTVPTADLGDLEHTRVGRWAGSLDAASSTLALVLDTGDRVAVTGPGLVGRRPLPGAEQWAHLVTIDDPEQSVSSTHLAFWPVDGGLDVVDRGSTNGTVLLDAAGKPWSLPPGQPARVGAGWTLVLGSRRITVTTA